MSDPAPSTRPPELLSEGSSALQSAAGSADGGDFYSYELNAFRFLLGRNPAFGFERRSVESLTMEVLVKNFGAFVFEYADATAIGASGVGVYGSDLSSSRYKFRPGGTTARFHLGDSTYRFYDIYGTNGNFSSVQASSEIITEGTLQLTGDLSPSQITADQDDYNPTGLASATVVRLSSDASRNITGMLSVGAGLVRVLHNVGSNNIVLVDESGSSIADGRFALAGANLTLTPDESAILIYDDMSSRWRAGAVYQVATTPTAAAQSDQETGTSTTTYVSPGRQQYHPSAAKCWGKFTANSTTIEASYNITSVADTGTGVMTVTIATDFSGIDWAAGLTVELSGTDGQCAQIDTAPAAGTVVLGLVEPVLDNRVDPVAWHFAAYGDQA